MISMTSDDVDLCETTLDKRMAHMAEKWLTTSRLALI